MKKLSIYLVIILSSLQSIGQKKTTAMIGYTSLDKKGVVAKTTIAMSSAFVTLDLQSDGPKMLSLSAGLNIAKKQDKTKVYLMPGAVYDWGRSKLHYSLALLSQIENKESTEAQFLIKGLSSGNGYDRYLRLKAGGEVLFGKLIKFGPYLEGELQKEKGVLIQKPYPDIDMIFIEKLVSFGGKIKWHPKIIKNLSVSGFGGMQSKSISGKYLHSGGGPKRQTENKFAFGLSLEYKF